MKRFAVLAALALLLRGGIAHAGIIITENLGGPSEFNAGLVWGQSLITPSGGPWNDLTFNFFSNVRPTTPAASGTAFLLTQAYLGMPSDLSSSTPGFLAQSTGVVNGQWDFAPGVTVQPNTTYWVYENVALGGISGGNSVPGIGSYVTNSSSGLYGGKGGSLNFRLSGDVVVAAVPEPASLTLLGVGAAGLLGYGWRVRRRRLPAAAP